MHRRAFVVQACICLPVGDGVNSHGRDPPPEEPSIQPHSPGHRLTHTLCPLLFRRWCFLLSCDRAVVGLGEHQRKARGGGRRLGVFERGSGALTGGITAASQGMRPALASDISPFSQQSGLNYLAVIWKTHRAFFGHEEPS